MPSSRLLLLSLYLFSSSSSSSSSSFVSAKTQQHSPRHLPSHFSAGEQCGTTESYCASSAGCCASQYSPTKLGCLIDAGEVSNASVGCGDGLTVNADNQVCCKMGPPKAPSTTQPNVRSVTALKTHWICLKHALPKFNNPIALS